MKQLVRTVIMIYGEFDAKDTWYESFPLLSDTIVFDYFFIFGEHSDLTRFLTNQIEDNTIWR